MNLSNIFNYIYNLFRHVEGKPSVGTSPAPSPQSDLQVNAARLQKLNPNATSSAMPTATPTATPIAAPAAQQAAAVMRPHNQSAQPSQFPLPDLSQIDQKASNYGQILPLAYKIAKQNGLPPAAVIGQIAAEGRGTSKYAQTRNNWLSVGAYTNNPDAARSYPTVAANLQDYANLIKTDPRYSQAWANRGNPVKFAQGVANAGYATDPNYYNNVVNSPEFRFYQNQP